MKEQRKATEAVAGWPTTSSSIQHIQETTGEEVGATGGSCHQG